MLERHEKSVHGRARRRRQRWELRDRRRGKHPVSLAHTRTPHQTLFHRNQFSSRLLFIIFFACQNSNGFSDMAKLLILRNERLRATISSYLSGESPNPAALSITITQSSLLELFTQSFLLGHEHRSSNLKLASWRAELVRTLR